jgi:hypothetical protein
VNDLMNLARMTVANLPKGKLNLTDEEIIAAMVEATAKNTIMAQQLLSNRTKQEAFKKVIAPMFWETVHSNINGDVGQR